MSNNEISAVIISEIHIFINNNIRRNKINVDNYVDKLLNACIKGFINNETSIKLLLRR